MESALFELDTMGILRTTKMPPNLAWMGDSEASLLIDVLRAGEDGLTRRKLEKLKEPGADSARRLELRNLVSWERDRFGARTFLVLTWQGQEAAQTLLKVSKNASQKTGTYVPAV